MILVSQISIWVGPFNYHLSILQNEVLNVSFSLGKNKEKSLLWKTIFKNRRPNPIKLPVAVLWLKLFPLQEKPRCSHMWILSNIHSSTILLHFSSEGGRERIIKPMDLWWSRNSAKNSLGEKGILHYTTPSRGLFQHHWSTYAYNHTQLLVNVRPGSCIPLSYKVK